MISTQYLKPVIFLLLIALIPTIIHNYFKATTQDGKHVNDIPKRLGKFNSFPAKRDPQWGKNLFNSFEWVERTYFTKDDSEIHFFALRSYDHKSLYHHPELALSYAQNLVKKSIAQLPGYPNIPVHILQNEDNSMLVAYVLIYENNFIKNPIKHQLQESIKLLVSPRKPITLLYAAQAKLTDKISFEQSDIAKLLELAIQSFQTQTGTNGRSNSTQNK